ncbi:MAG: TolC family protein [Coraliomargaritaceae bacterium]
MHTNASISIFLFSITAIALCTAEKVSAEVVETVDQPVVVDSKSSVEIDLETAVAYSLNQNPNVKISSSNVALRSGLLQSVSGEFDWTPFAAVDFDRVESPVLTLISPSDTLINETIEYSIGMRKKFRNGIEVTPSVSAEIETNYLGISETSSAASLWNLEVLIPLLKGGGRTSANARERAFDYDLQAARSAYLQVLSDQALLMINAYWRYAASSARVDILAGIEQRAQNLIDTTRSMVDAKILSPSVLPQAKANLNDQSALYLAAKTDQAQDRYNFGLALGLEPEEFVHIPVPVMKGSSGEARPVIDYSELIRLTFNRRSDIRSIRQSLQGRSVQLDGAKHDLLPRLDLILSTGYTGGNSKNEPLAVLGDNLRGTNWGVEVVMDFPFGNNFRRGNVSQYEAEVYRTEQQLIRLKQRVSASAMEALDVMNFSFERLRIAQDTEQLYKEAVAITAKRLAAGEASVFEVIDMEGRYARSSMDSISAQRDYYISVGRLRFETGTLFEELTAQGSFVLSKLDDPSIPVTPDL